MKITINGNLQEVDSVRTIAELLYTLRVPVGSALIELNGNILTRGSFQEVAVNEGDTIEIVQMVAGG
jgi:thiamine biosynthesis protein ThiS